MIPDYWCQATATTDRQPSLSTIFREPACSKKHRDKIVVDTNNAAMEVVAAVASVTALIQISAACVRALTEITQKFRDAPEGLLQVSRLLNLLHSELHFIEGLKSIASGEDLALLPDETCRLSETLQITNSLVQEVLTACEKCNGRSKTRNQISWVFHDEGKMISMMARLQEVRMSLQTILSSINIRISSLSRKAIAASSDLAKTRHVALIEDIASIRKTVNLVAQRKQPQKDIVLKGLVTRDPHEGIDFWTSLKYLEKSWLRFLGIEAVVSVYGNDYQTTYDFYARQSLFGLKVFCLDLCIRRFPLAGLGISIVSSGIKVKNIIPEDSLIIEACKKGDVISVRELFRTGQASPDDVTPENSNPLRYAIEYGSKEVVQTILLSGGDPNSSFGKMITSPLEWAFASRRIDIARLLIERGSRVDHISAKGWTPAFDLFGYDWLHGMRQPSCLEYLQLLSAAGYSDWDIQDSAGWTVMHGAAFFGTAEDISALVNVGASVSIASFADQTPVRLAVAHNKTESFLELAKYLPASFVDERDKRGWTLLHEAAWVGSKEMLDLVFQYEPDPHMLTYKTAFDVPPGLERRELAPIDIARHQSDHHFKVFAEALALAGHDISLVPDSEDDEKDDLFLPAYSEKV